MIYLDNAATTLQKPPCVGQAMLDALEHAGNPGRGAHEPTLHAARIVYHARETLATLLHAEGPDCIAFTANVTQALNTAFCGLVRPGDGAGGPGGERRADLLGDVACGDLVAEGLDRVGGGADPHEPGVDHGTGEGGVLGEEPVAGVQTVAASGHGGGKRR